MPRLSDTAPPRLLGIEAISLDGGRVAVLTLDTDDGTMEFAINRGFAAEIAALMIQFLEEAKLPPKRKKNGPPRKL